MIIYKTDFLTIAYYESDKLIEATWQTYAAGEDYRAGLLQYVEALRNYDVKCWLGDYRQARVVRLADQQWTREEWAPLFFPLSSQLDKMARVKSIDVAARISSENMFQDLDLNALPFTFMEFEDYGKARHWVLG
jgi:hypothetical protein